MTEYDMAEFVLSLSECPLFFELDKKNYAMHEPNGDT
jgi:hypothetical protein